MGKFKINQWDIYYKQRYLGKTKNTTSKLTVTGKYVTVDDVETVEGIYASLEKGIVPKFSTEFYNTDFDFIWGILLEGRLDGDSAGSKKNYYMGDNLNNEMEEIGGELLLHPAGVPLTNTDNDIKLFNTAALVNENEFMGDRDNADSFAVEFETYPDENRIGSRRYGVFGNWEIDASVALAVFIQPGERALLPGRSMVAASLVESQSSKWQGIAVFGNETGYLDVATIVVPNQRSWDFDQLSFPNLLKAGMYLFDENADEEWQRIESVVYTSATAGTVTVEPGVLGSKMSGFPIDASLVVYDDISFENRTNSGEWAIDVSTFIDVGNTYGGSGNERKGIIYNKNAGEGSGNVTFTFGGKASVNFVVTAVTNEL